MQKWSVVWCRSLQAIIWLTSMEFLAKEIKKSPYLMMPEASVVKGLTKKKALYILSWVGGV